MSHQQNHSEPWKQTVYWLNDALEKHRQYRRRTLNLIASENVMSPAVERYYALDLGHRYGNYEGLDAHDRKYLGNRYLAELENRALQDVCALFHAVAADLRPLSGHVAGAGVILGICKPGDLVLELDAAAGGHRLAEKLCKARLVNLRVESVPFDGQDYQVDIERTIQKIHNREPRLVIAGSSNYLFPTPLGEIAEACRQVGTILLMDAAHILGLIAGGVFPQPLVEGADLMISSTHKTFAGPQGGILLGRTLPPMEQVVPAIYPGLVTNHHLMRIPAMIAAVAEWRTFGADYARAIVENAIGLADALEGLGIPVVRTSAGTTKSHTILIKTQTLNQKARDIARRMEDCGVIAGSTLLPIEQGGEGIRLGVQEITRLGLKSGDLASLAQLIRDSILDSSIEDVRQRVEQFSASLVKCHYCQCDE